MVVCDGYCTAPLLLSYTLLVSSQWGNNQDWIIGYSTYIYTKNSKRTQYYKSKGGTQVLSYRSLLNFILLGLPTCVSSSRVGNLLQEQLIPVLQLHKVNKSDQRCIIYQTAAMGCRDYDGACCIPYYKQWKSSAIVYSKTSTSTAEQQLLNLTWEIRNCSWCCLSISTSCNKEINIILSFMQDTSYCTWHKNSCQFVQALWLSWEKCALPDILTL